MAATRMRALVRVGILHLAVWTYLPHGASGDCLLGGDLMVPEGRSVGFTGHTCTGTSTFSGTSGVCTNGEIVDRPYEGTCSGSVPYCVQCEAPGDKGAALCLATADVPESCSQADPGRCVVGAEELTAGQLYRTVGHECTGESTFDGEAGFCRNGKIEYEPYSGTCPSGNSYCVQCEPVGPGGAQCLSTPERPSHCSGPGADCLVGDMMVRDGDSVGVIGETCTGEATYNGTQSFCRDGEVVKEPYQGECSGTVPYCVQCNTPGTWGAALCLSKPDKPSHCSFLGDIDTFSGLDMDKLKGDLLSDVQPDVNQSDVLSDPQTLEETSSSMRAAALLPLGAALLAAAPLHALLL